MTPGTFRHAFAWTRIVGFLVIVLATSPSLAQPAAKGEAENLVPPGGAAFDIPVHAGEVCILSFPESLKGSALASSSDFEIKAWGSDGVAVRASGKAATATVALSTISGNIKINVTLHVVPAKQDALTLVRFKPASAEDAFEAKVAAEVARRVAPLEAELASVKKAIDAQIRERADGLMAERLLKRNEVISLNAHERNNANVITNVERALLLGDDGYVFFEIENRGRGPFRLARAAVYADNSTVSGPARMFSTAVDRDPSIIGIVPAGATARGVVVVHNASQVLKKNLELELADPDGTGTIRLTRGIAFR